MRCNTSGLLSCFLLLTLALPPLEVVGEESLRQAAGVEPPSEPLTVQYHRAYLELCRIELAKALKSDQGFRGNVAPSLTAELRMNVAAAEQQLEQALAPQQNPGLLLHKRHAEQVLQIAHRQFEQAQQALSCDPNSVSELELESLRLTFEVARLRLALLRDPAYLPTLLDEMQWQIDRLREDVFELHKRTRRLETQSLY